MKFSLSLFLSFLVHKMVSDQVRTGSAGSLGSSFDNFQHDLLPSIAAVAVAEVGVVAVVVVVAVAVVDWECSLVYPSAAESVP